GVCAQFVSGRWIFWINVPLAVLAAVMLWRRFVEPVHEGQREPVDFLGATLLTGGSTLLVLGLLQAGTWGWVDARTIGVLTGGAVLLALFVLRSHRVRYPILRLEVLRRRLIATTTIAAFMVGVIVLGLSTYVPIYALGVLGVEPLVAGFALAALSVGWPLTATWSGQVYLRVGFRRTAQLGAALVLVGSALALLLAEHTDRKSTRLNSSHVSTS